MIALGFVVAAAVAGVIRYLAAERWNRPLWPFGTLVVNVFGAGALGALAGSESHVATIVGVGALGSLTTFSTAAAETRAMVVGHALGRAVGYLVATVVLGVGAAWIGLELR